MSSHQYCSYQRSMLAQAAACIASPRATCNSAGSCSTRMSVSPPSTSANTATAAPSKNTAAISPPTPNAATTCTATLAQRSPGTRSNATPDGVRARVGSCRSIISPTQGDPDEQLSKEESGHEVQPQEPPPAGVSRLAGCIGQGSERHDRQQVGQRKQPRQHRRPAGGQQHQATAGIQHHRQAHGPPCPQPGGHRSDPTLPAGTHSRDRAEGLASNAPDEEPDECHRSGTAGHPPDQDESKDGGADEVGAGGQ